jgi:hypothetical protein
VAGAACCCADDQQFAAVTKHITALDAAAAGAELLTVVATGQGLSHAGAHTALKAVGIKTLQLTKVMCMRHSF